MIYKFSGFVMMLIKALSDHQHEVEYASEGFKGVDSLRLQIYAIQN